MILFLFHFATGQNLDHFYGTEIEFPMDPTKESTDSWFKTELNEVTKTNSNLTTFNLADNNFYFD